MKFALILPVYNRLDFTRRTLTELSVLAGDADEFRIHIILIDDGSTDGTSDWVSTHFPDVTLLQGDGNLWWSGAVNRGAAYAMEKLKVDYIILWNNDISVNRDYFSALVRITSSLQDPAVIGSKIMVAEQPELVWSMGGYFNPRSGKYGMYGYFKQDNEEYGHVREVDWLTGMGTIIPCAVINEIGYWNREEFPQYHGDSDFTYRAKKAGYRVLVDPSLIIHNSVRVSGISEKNNFKDLKRLLTDTRSKSNLKINLRYYRRHATSLRAYLPLCRSYFRLFGGFVKWKVLALFKKNRETL